MLKSLLRNLPSFIREEGREDDVCILSGIKIARNISDIPFPKRASREEKERVFKLVKDVVSKSELLKNLNLFEINMLDITDIERRVLVHMQIIPEEFLKDPYSKYLFLSKDGRVIFMLNGEDHIVIKIVESGLSINRSLDMGMKICDELENFLDIAYMKDFGYLTASIENVGTGLKAFIHMHLPILKLLGKVESIKKSAPKFSLNIETIFDSVFKISNITTLGRSEENLAKTIETIGGEIGNMERRERERILKSSPMDILNEIERAKGIINYSLRITYSEAMDLLSWIRLGASLKMLKIPVNKIDELFIRINPEYEKIEFGDVSDEGLNSLRVKLLKEYLKVIL